MKFLLILFVFFASVSSFAQSGEMDTTFVTGTGFNGKVNVIKKLASGKILVGGDFTSYNGSQYKYLVRLRNDGSLDTSFALAGSGLNGAVTDIEFFTDSSIIIVGSYSMLNGSSVHPIIRLSSNGGLINDFNLTFSGGSVFTLEFDPVIQRLYIGGSFSSINSSSYKHIARIKVDGSIDQNFNVGTGFTGSFASTPVYRIRIANDHSIVVGGDFLFYKGGLAPKLCRIDSLGNLDNNFTNSLAGGFNGIVYDIQIAPNGKLFVGGTFTSVSGNSRKYICKLQADGSLDTTFSFTGYGLDGYVYSIARAYADKIFVGGNFWNYNITPDRGLTLLNADGSRDYTFNKGAGFSTSSTSVNISDILVLSDTSIYAGGLFNSYDSVSVFNIIKIKGNGGMVISAPSVSTNSTSLITHYSARVLSDVTSDGNSPITSKGVCWSTSPNPDLNDSFYNAGIGTGTYFSYLTGLQDSTIYYVRAFATNSAGTSYGAELTFKTLAYTTYSCGNVTFNYNGASVTYGTVKGSLGWCWLDRNLGASRVALYFNDEYAYGDLFQWGRDDDGHQLRTSTVSNSLSSSTNPGHSSFILPTASPFNWMNTLNNNLWDGVTATNNPCPNGFRLPTQYELLAETQAAATQNANGAFELPLRFTGAGLRGYLSGQLIADGAGHYWTSDVVAGSTGMVSTIHIDDTSIFAANTYRAIGMSVRCIKDYNSAIKTVETNTIINIFPNPASDFFSIEDPANQFVGATLTLFSLDGVLLKQVKIESSYQKISVSDLSAGAYLVVVETAAKQEFVQKIIVN